MTIYKSEGFEKKFFVSYSGYDQLDVLTLAYYDCELVPELASKVGVEVVHEAVISFEDSTLHIRIKDTDETALTWNLLIGLGERQ